MRTIRLAPVCFSAALLFGPSGATLAYATPITLEISLGIRETGGTGPIFSNGGTSDGIEWVNLDGQTLVADGTWQQFTFTPAVDPLTPFAGTTANGVLDTEWGVLEHIRFRSTGDAGPWTICIDDIVNTDSAGAEIIGFEGFATGTEVVFQEPGFSGTTSGNIEAANSAGVSDMAAHTGNQCYAVTFEFVDGDPSRWLRLTTFNATNLPNPAIHLLEPGSAFSPTISFWLIAQPGRQTVPEPATLTLVGLGVMGLAAGSVRRKARLQRALNRRNRPGV